MLPALLRLLGGLPLPVLHGLAWLLAGVLHTLVRYRRRVVAANLQRAFPQLSAAQHRQLQRRYYRHLANLMLETLAALRMRPAAFARRVRFENPPLLQQLAATHPNVVVVMGHCGNWEWVNHAAALLLRPAVLHPGFKPVRHRPTHALLLHLRSRMGQVPVPMQQLPAVLGRPTPPHKVVVLIADQSPPRDAALWVPFLGQPTAVFRGPEVLARRANVPVVFAHIGVLGRGRYGVRFELLCECPRDLPPGELTRRHVQALEANIVAQPWNWLWSHRRWKHRPPDAPSS